MIIIAQIHSGHTGKAEQSNRRWTILREDWTFYTFTTESSNSRTGAVLCEEISLGYG